MVQKAPHIPSNRGYRWPSDVTTPGSDTHVQHRRTTQENVSPPRVTVSNLVRLIVQNTRANVTSNSDASGPSLDHAQFTWKHVEPLQYRGVLQPDSHDHTQNVQSTGNVWSSGRSQCHVPFTWKHVRATTAHTGVTARLREILPNTWEHIERPWRVWHKALLVFSEPRFCRFGVRGSPARKPSGFA